MHPRAWSAATWRAMHAVALGYPNEGASELQKLAYRSFFVSLGSVLPCETCARGYSGMLSGGGLAALDRALDGGGYALFAWTVDVHNSVGAKAGGAGAGRRPWTVERARRAILGDDGQGTSGGEANGASDADASEASEAAGASEASVAPPSTVGGDALVLYPTLVLSAALCVGFLAAYAAALGASRAWRSAAALCRHVRRAVGT